MGRAARLERDEVDAGEGIGHVAARVVVPGEAGPDGAGVGTQHRQRIFEVPRLRRRAARQGASSPHLTKAERRGEQVGWCEEAPKRLPPHCNII